MIVAVINAGPKGIIVCKFNLLPTKDNKPTASNATNAPTTIIGIIKVAPNHVPKAASSLKSPNPNPSIPFQNL